MRNSTLSAQTVAPRYCIKHQLYDHEKLVVFQVSICPECREPYPVKPRRHRYAEKAADELNALESERAEILDSSTKNAVPDTSVETQRENTTSAINVLDANDREKPPTQTNPKSPVKPKPSKPEGDPLS